MCVQQSNEINTAVVKELTSFIVLLPLFILFFEVLYYLEKVVVALFFIIVK